MQVLLHRQPITTYIQTPSADEGTARKLAFVLDLLEFARTDLGLPDNGSYRGYSDIGRDYVIWNVFATQRLSLQPRQWCYLFVGCLAYRGYYRKDTALEYARQLELEGLDVFVGGVAAYSTLGWFNDPVLNTMMQWDDTYLARVILHELAHQKLYVRDDTEFNEAFADAVATIGTGLWLEQTATPRELQVFRTRQGYDNEFVDLVLEYIQKLEELFNSDRDNSYKLAHKQDIYNQLRSQYHQMRQTWIDYDVYDTWLGNDLNNAKLAAFATYRKLVPDFLAMYAASDYDLDVFYERVMLVSGCGQDERRMRLRNLQLDPRCEPGQ